MKRFAFGLALAGLLASSATSQAAPVFTATFDDVPTAVPVLGSPASVDIGDFGGNDVFFTSTSGNFDIIGPGSGFDFQPGNGNYVDLHGTSGGGVDPYTHGFTLQDLAAGMYELSFELAGNQRGLPDITTFVSIVASAITLASDDFTLASGDDFATKVISFTHTGGDLTVTFSESSTNANIGNLLDDVSVSAVPEPGTLALLGMGGLGMLGGAIRRRRRAAA